MFVLASGADPQPDRRRRVKQFFTALLLAGVAVPAHADSALEAASEAAQEPPEESRPQDIVVIGQSLFRDIVPESDLDEDAIESYGVSTVDELLGEVEADLGDDEEPLILVNGERVNALDEIGAFPVEALRKVQVLPRGSAVRVGGRTGQRVISLTLQNKMRAATVTAASRVATDGDWQTGRGEGLLTYVQGSTRANLGLRFRGEPALLESERGIIQPETHTQFALEGNVVGFPNTGGEIDPFLSAAAGQIVTIAPVPMTAAPTLADFAAVANQQNSTARGEFRTLRSRIRNYDLNGTFSTRLAPWLTSNATLRLSRNVSRSLQGLPSALFVLSPSNAASPFSTDVALAFYGPQPLRSRSVRTGGEGRLTLNGRFGRWTSNLNARHSVSKDTFDTQRQSGLGSIVLDDAVNPFATDLPGLIGIRSDGSSSRTVASLAQLSFTGPVVTLPAGPVRATIEGRANWYSLRSRSSFTAANPDRRFRRDEQGIRASVDVPLTSRGGGVFPAIGDLGATAELAHVRYSDAGGLDRHAFGLTWEPVQALRLRGSIEKTERPPSIQILGSPVVETPDVRVFDPLTGQTVDVTQITGGNPELSPEKLEVRRLTALLRLVPRLNLQLNAEYTDTDARNFISSLPPASLAVMLAFPDRYVRDSSGSLTIVDLRPVNFESHREERLRWGLSMRTKLRSGNIIGSSAGDAGPATPSESEAGEEPAEQPQEPVRQGRTASTYLQLAANHSVVFSDKLAIRPGLDSVDLLGGGAIGIGGGRLRHQVDGTAAVTSGGLGARIGVTWRGASRLDTSIGDVSNTLHFSPVTMINLRLFTDARRIFGSDRAKGLRFSIDVVNLTNDRQRVRDSLGNTPIQYQPAYRDPLGRTIEFEIRKVF